MRPQVLFSILVVCSMPALSAASIESPPTVEEYLTHIQTSGPLAIVSYCGVEVPELRDELEDEYKKFVEKIASAMQPLRERLGATISQPVSSGAEKFLELGDRILQAVKQYPAESYCPWVLDSMRRSSADSLRSKIEEAYARYERLAAAKKDQANQ